jgi:endonuclease YncB( thermonuclease family)
MYAADLPRRWRLFKPYLLPTAGGIAAVFVFGSALSPQMHGGISTMATPASAARSTDVTTGSITNGNPDALSGRGTVLSGDRLRVSGKEVKLAGIEAPHAAQPCFKENGRRWECASSARSALRKLVRGRTVSCELKDAAAEGLAVAHCRSGSEDLAAQMVRSGYAFASSEGLYASEEEAARKDKSGIWQGTADRPQDWRTKLWDDAKRSAPDGCPIKGLVRNDGRFYAMPWSDGYAARSLRSGKGERWFCSEDEARAAGFKEVSKL